MRASHAPSRRDLQYALHPPSERYQHKLQTEEMEKRHKEIEEWYNERVEEEMGEEEMADVVHCELRLNAVLGHLQGTRHDTYES